MIVSMRVPLVLALCAAGAGCGSSVSPFHGDWQAVSYAEQGKPGPAPGAIHQVSVQVDHDRFEQVETTMYPGQPVRQATTFTGKLTVNSSTSPAQIDVTPPEGPGQAKQRLGVYQFDGPKLKVCLGGPGQPRPAGFEQAGPGSILMTLERKQ